MHDPSSHRYRLPEKIKERQADQLRRKFARTWNQPKAGRGVPLALVAILIITFLWLRR